MSPIKKIKESKESILPVINELKKRKELKVKRTLLGPALIKRKEVTEINITELIFRPALKKIVFIIEEANRIVIYEGEADFNAHKDDSEELLINKLLQVINTKFSV